jgi:hypothetical protein
MVNMFVDGLFKATIIPLSTFIYSVSIECQWLATGAGFCIHPFLNVFPKK